MPNIGRRRDAEGVGSILTYHNSRRGSAQRNWPGGTHAAISKPYGESSGDRDA
jgi:hypothetical protein